MKKQLPLAGIFLLVLLSASPVKAQTGVFNIYGNISMFYDMYDYSAIGYDDFRPRHPSDLARFSAHATITAGSHFSMPFSIDITNQSASYHLPSLPEERFIDYVQNPRNNISINPTYKWAQGFFGTQSPNFSALTTGDIPIFGVGMELTPGRLLFSAHYGKSQLAINANPAENIAGAWEQRILATRAGFGNRQGTMFTLNLVHRADDVSSVEFPPIGMTAQEGLTISPHVQIRITENLVFSTETAGSVFTRDLEGPEMPIESNILDAADSFIPVKGSTNTDFSNISSLDWQGEKLGLGAEVRYIGPGFEPVGYRAVERDLIDYNVRANLRLLENRVMINGTAGIRDNNLQSTTSESTRRFIANVNLFYQVTEAFNVASNFSNFGFRNNVLFDTLKVEMIQNVFSLTPSYQVNGNNLNHLISTTFSLQLFDEYNVVSGDFINTRSTAINANYNLVFTDFPLNVGFMGMYLNNETVIADLDIYHVGLTVRYRFFENRLSPSLMLSHSGISREGFSTDYRWRANLRTEYRVTESLSLRLGYTYSNYQYGSSRPGATTNEHRLQLSLSQRL